MRLLALALFSLTAHAATITTTASGFTAGPVTFSNVTYVNTVTDGLGLEMIDGVFTPAAYGTDPSLSVLAIPPVILFGTGTSYTQYGVVGQSSVSETMSADFTVAPGFAVRAIGVQGVAGDSGVAVGESVTITSPCVGGFSGWSGSSGGSCTLASPLQSGTLSITLEIHVQSCGNCHGVGVVGLSYASLYLQEVPAVHMPEPGTWGLVIFGIAASLCWKRRPSPGI